MNYSLEEFLLLIRFLVQKKKFNKGRKEIKEEKINEIKRKESVKFL